MRAGRLRHRIEIQQPVTVQDVYGEPLTTWERHALCWASAEPLRGQELFNARQTLAEVNVRFRLRYLAGVEPDMRVLFDGRTFDLVEIIDVDERHKELQLLAVERPA